MQHTISANAAQNSSTSTSCTQQSSGSQTEKWQNAQIGVGQRMRQAACYTAFGLLVPATAGLLAGVGAAVFTGLNAIKDIGHTINTFDTKPLQTDLQSLSDNAGTLETNLANPIHNLPGIRNGTQAISGDVKQIGSDGASLVSSFSDILPQIASAGDDILHNATIAAVAGAAGTLTIMGVFTYAYVKVSARRYFNPEPTNNANTPSTTNTRNSTQTV